MSPKLPAIAIWSLFVCAGCAMHCPSYRTDVRISPAAEPHRYNVEFKLSETGRSGVPSVLLAPKLTVLAGQEGMLSVGDDSQREAIVCTALLRESAKSLDATTDVDVRRHGRTLWHSTQSVSLAQP